MSTTQQKEKLLANKHAMITGGGTGIGAAIADKLDSMGAKVTLLGRRAEPLEKKCKDLSNAQAITMDVSSAESVKQAFEQAGSVDILVNNAGVAVAAPFKRTDLELWEKTIDVNLKGVYLCAQAALASMADKDYGRIINIASTAALKGYAYVTAYCAAKHGVVGLTRALALELANSPVTVNSVCPGYTETDILSDALDNIMQKTGCSREQAEQQLVANNPQKRFIQPSEVASAVGWLCLPESSSVTGQSISVAGGETT